MEKEEKKRLEQEKKEKKERERKEQEARKKFKVITNSSVYFSDTYFTSKSKLIFYFT